MVWKVLKDDKKVTKKQKIDKGKNVIIDKDESDKKFLDIYKFFKII